MQLEIAVFILSNSRMTRAVSSSLPAGILSGLYADGGQEAIENKLLSSSELPKASARDHLSCVRYRLTDVWPFHSMAETPMMNVRKLAGLDITVHGFGLILIEFAAGVGLPAILDAQYVGEMSPNWYARSTPQSHAILAGLKPHLATSVSDTVMRYTMGKGGVGLEREAYYAGWVVIGELRHDGWTFPKFARVKIPKW